MPERWERELRKLVGVDVDESLIRDRVSQGSTGDRLPGRRERVTAALVAILVFAASAVFAWRALAPDDSVGVGVPSHDWPIVTVSFAPSDAGPGTSTLSIGDESRTGSLGLSTSPDEPYPYSWMNPQGVLTEKPLEIPMGSELRLQGDVSIRELLFGNAEALDAGAGTDSGVIWSDRPDFSKPYFFLWDEEPRRQYLKFFGTWADGTVLDVYFEVRFVAPSVDLSDRTAHVEVTPEPMGGVLFYGGQRMPVALNGGSYGRTSMTAELAGWDGSEIVATVAAGTMLTIDGPHLIEASRRIGGLPLGENAGPLGDTLPTEPGRYIVDLDITWDDGSASMLVPIKIVEAPAVSVEPSPAPTSTSSVVIDIRRSSPETGDPEAIARYGELEQWICPDGWNLVNPDDTTEGTVFDCGQNDVFEAPAGTPIAVTGDFATVNVSTRLSGEGSTGAPTDRVGDLDPGTVVTYAYEVTWEDGSEASFWLIVTVAGGHAPIPGVNPRIVIRVHGLGERSNEMPTATYSFDGQTETACTQSWEWITGDGTTAGGEAFCSGGPAIEVPPATLIAIESATATRVTTTRTTTPYFPGELWLTVSADWAEGTAKFIMPLSVDASTPDLELVVLDCRPESQVEFTGPDGRIEPGASAYIVGNLPGFERTDVVEQMTRKTNGATEWSGIWQVVRDGQVVASVDWDALSGTACRGSGIGGT
jgi:hypothetical protein